MSDCIITIVVAILIANCLGDNCGSYGRSNCSRSRCGNRSDDSCNRCD
ncbi:MAG: hypothetical protein IJN34_07695 [Clostridia bacterium]|nr:hypothetical protein [Clostridia bacterium]